MRLVTLIPTFSPATTGPYAYSTLLAPLNLESLTCVLLSGSAPAAPDSMVTRPPHTAVTWYKNTGYRVPLRTPISEVFMRAWFLIGQSTDASVFGEGLAVLNGNTLLCSVRFRRLEAIGLNYAVEGCVGTNVVGRVQNCVSVHAPVCIEARFKMGSTDGAIEARVNGEQLISFSGNTGTSQIDTLYFGDKNGAEWTLLFEGVANDTSGDADNTWPGYAISIPVFGESLGSSTGWTFTDSGSGAFHFSRWPSAQPAAYTSSADAELSMTSLKTGRLPAPADIEITSVRILASIGGSGSAGGFLRLGTETVDAQSSSSPALPGQMSLVDLGGFASNPFTGQSWTLDDIENSDLEIGVRSSL